MIPTPIPGYGIIFSIIVLALLIYLKGLKKRIRGKVLEMDKIERYLDDDI